MRVLFWPIAALALGGCLQGGIVLVDGQFVPPAGCMQEGVVVVSLAGVDHANRTVWFTYHNLSPGILGVNGVFLRYQGMVYSPRGEVWDVNNTRHWLAANETAQVGTKYAELPAQMDRFESGYTYGTGKDVSTRMTCLLPSPVQL